MSRGIGDNNPPDETVMLVLTKDEAAFLMENCESNIQMGLKVLAGVQAGSWSREVAEKTVALMEQFRPIRDKLKPLLDDEQPVRVRRRRHRADDL